MVGLIIGLVAGVALGVLGIKCLRGVDWIFISGWTIMPKEDKQKFKKKHDMVAMNRLIGKRVFIPIAVFCVLGGVFSFLYTQFDPVWMQSSWLAIPILAVVIGVFVPVFSALPKVLGTHFEIPNNAMKSEYIK